MSMDMTWEPLLDSDVIRVERQRNKTGWIVRGYFMRESAMDLAFVPDSKHAWKIEDAEHLNDDGFFKSRLWTTPGGWLHLTLRESPPALGLTFMPS